MRIWERSYDVDIDPWGRVESFVFEPVCRIRHMPGLLAFSHLADDFEEL